MNVNITINWLEVTFKLSMNNLFSKFITSIDPSNGVAWRSEMSLFVIPKSKDRFDPCTFLQFCWKTCICQIRKWSYFYQIHVRNVKWLLFGWWHVRASEHSFSYFLLGEGSCNMFVFTIFCATSRNLCLITSFLDSVFIIDSPVR